MFSHIKIKPKGCDDVPLLPLCPSCLSAVVCSSPPPPCRPVSQRTSWWPPPGWLEQLLGSTAVSSAVRGPSEPGLRLKREVEGGETRGWTVTSWMTFQVFFYYLDKMWIKKERRRMEKVWVSANPSKHVWKDDQRDN